jgi:hypothetical protein
MANMFTEAGKEEDRRLYTALDLMVLPDPELIKGIAVEMDPQKNPAWASFTSKYNTNQGAPAFWQAVNETLLEMEKNPCDTKRDFKTCAWERLFETTRKLREKYPKHGAYGIAKQLQSQEKKTGRSDLTAVFDYRKNIYREGVLIPDDKGSSNQPVKPASTVTTPSPMHTKMDIGSKAKQIPSWAQRPEERRQKSYFAQTAQNGTSEVSRKFSELQARQQARMAELTKPTLMERISNAGKGFFKKLVG